MVSEAERIADLVRAVHERTPERASALVDLASHPEQPYPDFVAWALDQYLDEAGPDEFSELVAAAAAIGNLRVIDAALHQHIVLNECDRFEAVHELVSAHRGLPYFSQLHDVLAVWHPEAAKSAFWDLVEEGWLDEVERFDYRSPTLRECQRQLAEMRQGSATPDRGGLRDLLNGLPQPPDCRRCADCGDCDGCRGCYGCTGCATCPGCRGCEECGRRPQAFEFAARTVGSSAVPCRLRIRRALQSPAGDALIGGEPVYAPLLAEALAGVPCMYHPLVDMRTDLRELVQTLDLVADGQMLRPGDTTGLRAAELLHDGRTFDYGVLPPGVALRRWQRDALDSWAAHGRRGIIEAVTGAGKTWLGTAAILEALSEGRLAVVVVPLRVLQEQWAAELGEALQHMNARVHLMGNGHRARPDSGVLVAVVNSLAAARGYPRGAPNQLAPLIVADECHNYGSEARKRALSTAFGPRLGLTATLDGADVSDFFSGTAFELGHARALAEKAISPYDVLIVRTPLDAAEVALYDDAHHRLKYAEADLVNLVPELSRLAGRFGPMSTAIRRLAADASHPAAGPASRWVEALEDRTAVLSQSQGKARGLSAVAPAIRASSGSLVFTMLREPARAATHLLERHGLQVQCIDGRSEQSFRMTVLQELMDGGLDAVVAPRILDEGVNVPRVDTAVVVASSRSRRQMIQRLGRIVRAKGHGKPAALLIVLAAKDTVEDPHSAEADGSFLHEVRGNAANAAVCDVEDGRSIAGFLASRRRRQAA